MGRGCRSQRYKRRQFKAPSGDELIVLGDGVERHGGGIAAQFQFQTTRVNGRGKCRFISRRFPPRSQSEQELGADPGKVN